MSTEVLVKPQGVRDENIGVALVALVTVLLAALYIGFDREVDQATTAQEEHQIDSRYDLNPAEQGLHADLLAATDEIIWRLDDQEPIDLATLADDLIPPFVQDAVSEERGAHQWSLLNKEGAWLYLGVSQNTEHAGSFLALIQADHAHSTQSSQSQADRTPESPLHVSIWYRTVAEKSLTDWPDQALETYLPRHGWKEVISHFDASVTRPGL